MTPGTSAPFHIFPCLQLYLGKPLTPFCGLLVANTVFFRQLLPALGYLLDDLSDLCHRAAFKNFGTFLKMSESI